LTVNPLLAVRRPVEVKVPAPVKLAPEAVKAVVPFGARTMLPVPAAPSCKVCPLVVASVPAAVRYVALLFEPDIDAVGVPPATLTKANLAEAVELPPSSTSSVVLVVSMVPGVTDCQ